VKAAAEPAQRSDEPALRADPLRPPDGSRAVEIHARATPSSHAEAILTILKTRAPADVIMKSLR
jgi:hypothetical protein